MSPLTLVLEGQTFTSTGLQTDKLNYFIGDHYKDVVGGYLISLNTMRELLVYNDLSEWKLPGGAIEPLLPIKDNRCECYRQVLRHVENQTGHKLQLGELLMEGHLVAVHTYTHGHVYDRTMQTANKYVIYLLSVDQFDQGRPRSPYVNYCRWLRLTSLPFYHDLEPLFNAIYDPCKLHIVFDLDGTLLESCFLTSNSGEKDAIQATSHIFQSPYIPDSIIQKDGQSICVWQRPYLHECLTRLSRTCHLAYWTAGIQPYQEVIINRLGLQQYTKRIYYRDACHQDSRGDYFKPLQSQQFDLSRTILIDDMQHNCDKNPHNSLKIPTWKIANLTRNDDLDDSYGDRELMYLSAALEVMCEKIIHKDVLHVKDLLGNRGYLSDSEFVNYYVPPVLEPLAVRQSRDTSGEIVDSELFAIPLCDSARAKIGQDPPW